MIRFRYRPTRVIPFLLLIALAAAQAWPGAAEIARQLTWDDLLPPGSDPPDPLMELPVEERFRLGFAANLRHMRSLGQVEPDNPAIAEADAFLEELRQTGIDVDGYMDRFDDYRRAIEERDRMLNDALDGRTVRIPGYLLPLDFEGTGVREFLLVPYVGACIHVPPPPPNQIVHVSMEGSFPADELFTPVWVEGKLSAERSSQSLSYVDGRADIPVGYKILAAAVELYEY